MTMKNLIDRVEEQVDGRHPLGARWTISLAALLLLGYTVLRAFTVSFTWDESWTYIHHVLPGMFFQQVHDQMGGNHHMLNVWGMMLCRWLFGDSELALRLPNLLAHALFLYASARIALRATTGVVALAAFLLLNAHPYLLDFFPLARGYGLACGWMMLSLWQASLYLRQDGRRMRHLAIALAAAVLSAMSHVIMVTYLLAFTLTLALSWLYGQRTAKRTAPSWKEPALLVAGVALGLALVLPNALALSHGGSLNFGCDTWWECVMGTLGMKLLYHQPYTMPVLRIMAILIAVWGACCALVALAAWKGGWQARLRPMAFGLLVLAACLVGFHVQMKVFGVPLPQSRTALFLVPLAMFPLAAGLVAWPGKAKVPAVLGGLLCVPLLAHAWNSRNLSYAVEWKPSGEVRHMIDIIQADHLPVTERRPLVTVAASDESWGAIPYYGKVRGLSWLSTTHRFPPDDYVMSDYYIVEYNGYDKVDEANWERLYFSESTRTSLYRDKRLRSTDLELLFHASDDLERPGLPGASAEHRTSGRQGVRLDDTTRAVDTLRWVVPERMEGRPLLVTGTVQVLQLDDSNWMAIVADVVRGGQVILRQVDGSNQQVVKFGEWSRAAVDLRVNISLEPGDEIRFWTAPQTRLPPIHVDELNLWISR